MQNTIFSLSYFVYKSHNEILQTYSTAVTIIHTPFLIDYVTANNFQLPFLPVITFISCLHMCTYVYTCTNVYTHAHKFIFNKYF